MTPGGGHSGSAPKAMGVAVGVGGVGEAGAAALGLVLSETVLFGCLAEQP